MNRKWQIMYEEKIFINSRNINKIDKLITRNSDLFVKIKKYFRC